MLEAHVEREHGVRAVVSGNVDDMASGAAVTVRGRHGLEEGVVMRADVEDSEDGCCGVEDAALISPRKIAREGLGGALDAAG